MIRKERPYYKRAIVLLSILMFSWAISVVFQVSNVASVSTSKVKVFKAQKNMALLPAHIEAPDFYTYIIPKFSFYFVPKIVGKNTFIEIQNREILRILFCYITPKLGP